MDIRSYALLYTQCNLYSFYIIYVCVIGNLHQTLCYLDYSSILFVSMKCQGGVQRVHIIDGTVNGSLLLELFTRDGAGTMIARLSLFFY
jgi:hypothetical protein